MNLLAEEENIFSTSFLYSLLDNNDIKYNNIPNFEIKISQFIEIKEEIPNQLNNYSVNYELNYSALNEHFEEKYKQSLNINIIESQRKFHINPFDKILTNSHLPILDIIMLLGKSLRKYIKDYTIEEKPQISHWNYVAYYCIQILMNSTKYQFSMIMKPLKYCY